MGTLKEGLWHHLPPEELLEQLGCHAERGLDPAEAESRLGQFGPNRLTPKKAKGPILRFLVQFHQPLVYILLAAGVTTGLISEWSDATAIFAVVLVNAIIGFVQESKALGAIEALSRAMTTSASVVRAAQPRLIPSEELVPGDIVTLQSGDKVPADMRLLRVRDLFLGLQGMIDPPREEAIEAVHACLRAGIQVKMITGDHALTASVIAEKIGIVTQPECLPSCAAVLTGKQMALLSPEELVSAAEETNVFARVAPEQKLNLVRALQAQGHVVAMTGDGVNDAPALKQADIGVAMGITGTEVSKEAADMVLTDDNFASIEAAVEEGRCVFDNLIKFLVWALPTNLGQGLVIIAAVFAGVPLPILPAQSLWINMTTAGSLGLMLAFEPKERGLMNRPPRHPSSPILSGVLIRRILFIGVILMAAAFGLFEWEEWTGAGDAAARTVTVNVFSVISCFYLLNCRSLQHSFLRVGPLSNKPAIVGIAFMVILQLLFTYLPLMNRLFHTVPIGYDSWLRIMAVGLISHWAVSFEKWLTRRKQLAVLK